MSRGKADPSAAQSALGVPVRCPQCQAAGIIPWSRLQNAMRCPQCECDFLVSRGGQIRRVADLPHVRYACPRCHKSGMLPTQLAGKSVACPHCKLPLARGPDQCLHGAVEAAEMWRLSAGRQQTPGIVQRVSERLTTPEGRLRKAAIAWLCVPALAIVWLAVLGLVRVFDYSLETRAERFTLACLSRDETDTEGFLEDDAVQRVEFERWHRRFASIQDQHRPAGDRVRVEASTVDSAPTERVLLVAMTSPLLGTRRHIQHWHLRDGTWLFDARATLADEEPPTMNRRGR